MQEYAPLLPSSQASFAGVAAPEFLIVISMYDCAKSKYEFCKLPARSMFMVWPGENVVPLELGTLVR